VYSMCALNDVLFSFGIMEAFIYIVM
jgi:hypothetical protein